MKRTWHTIVAEIAKERGISTAEARKLYKSGVRPLLPGDGQPAIGGLPRASLSEAVKSAEGFVAACNAAGADPQEVFDFVSKAAK
jgi:hypothetical protein